LTHHLTPLSYNQLIEMSKTPNMSTSDLASYESRFPANHDIVRQFKEGPYDGSHMHEDFKKLKELSSKILDQLDQTFSEVTAVQTCRTRAKETKDIIDYVSKKFDEYTRESRDKDLPPIDGKRKLVLIDDICDIYGSLEDLRTSVNALVGPKQAFDHNNTLTTFHCREHTDSMLETLMKIVFGEPVAWKAKPGTAGSRSKSFMEESTLDARRTASFHRSAFEFHSHDLAGPLAPPLPSYGGILSGAGVLPGRAGIMPPTSHPFQALHNSHPFRQAQLAGPGQAFRHSFTVPFPFPHPPRFMRPAKGGAKTEVQDASKDGSDGNADK
jgi:hypothetical protein